MTKENLCTKLPFLSIFAFQLSFLDAFKAVSGALYRLGKIEAMTRLGKEFEGSSLGVRATGGEVDGDARG